LKVLAGGGARAVSAHVLRVDGRGRQRRHRVRERSRLCSGAFRANRRA
jgi:hypothetical protein